MLPMLWITNWHGISSILSIIILDFKGSYQDKRYNHFYKTCHTNLFASQQRNLIILHKDTATIDNHQSLASQGAITKNTKVNNLILLSIHMSLLIIQIVATITAHMGINDFHNLSLSRQLLFVDSVKKHHRPPQ